MNALLLRTVLTLGLLFAVLNVVLTGLQYGFGSLPLRFWLAQLLLLPAMLAPARMFPQAAITRPYLQRAGLFALGWSAPLAVYRLSSDALRPDFVAAASLLSLGVICVLFGLIFAALRRPPEGE
ncbi:hypothetical protein [Deinococcus hopiensis]|uniref:Uncharacterized protein n=1 Tax=Deinococcus hopiensis KR-140 TaxID=695939 RepID=A0A1W1VML9_9DEIO|nr:hypothetical protein [Deinococcus hopiensis]SMB94533.1 hypothetical protein SAMN00790413_02423 [Deinococcus hopiensis KR-140]